MKILKIKYCSPQVASDFHQIVSLQKRNLPNHISKSEAESQGFVTVQHDEVLLEKMN